MKLLVTSVLLLALANSLAFAAPAPTATEIDSVVAAASKVEPGQSLEPFRQLEAWRRQSQSDRALREPIESALIKLLEPAASFDAQLFACKQLGIIGTPAALPALGKLLPEEKTAGIACLALTTYPKGKADDLLRATLPSAHGAARIQILETLGNRRDPRALPLLAEAAHDRDPLVAGAAISALGKLGNREAWQAISALRANATTALQPILADAELRCGSALAAAGDRKTAIAVYESLMPASEPPYLRRSAFTALTALDADHGQQRILNAIHGNDPVLKPVAIAAVRAVPAGTASDVFAKEMPKLQPNEQVWLIESLAVRNDAAARNAIGTSLSSSTPTVRRAALSAFSRIGDARTVPWLVPLLQTSKTAEEIRAVQATLVSLGGGSKTDEAIRAHMKAARGATRATLITVYSQRLGVAGNPLLLEETSHVDPLIAKTAFRELGRTAEPGDIAPLLQKLEMVSDPAVRAQAESSAAQALARVDNAPRRSAIILGALNQTRSDESRCALLGLLPACGDAAALAALKSAIADQNPKVRAAAVQALAEWPDASAWQPLLAVYQKPENESLRGTALRGLVRIASEENARPNSKVAERYMELLQGAKGDADLKLILGALGGATRPEALQLAVPLLSNSGVHAEAEVAVKKIAEAIKVKYPAAANEALQKLKPAQ